jgi:thiamine phosphate synthase YjbQ (UPF0047 family)
MKHDQGTDYFTHDDAILSCAEGSSWGSRRRLNHGASCCHRLRQFAQSTQVNILSSSAVVSVQDLRLVFMSSPAIYLQQSIQLKSKPRGVHHITEELLGAGLSAMVGQVHVGLAHLFLAHTSAGLSITENWDSDVPADIADEFKRICPDDSGRDARFRHSSEGPDGSSPYVLSHFPFVSSSCNLPLLQRFLNNSGSLPPRSSSPNN